MSISTVITDHPISSRPGISIKVDPNPDFVNQDLPCAVETNGTFVTGWDTFVRNGEPVVDVRLRIGVSETTINYVRAP